MSSEWMNERNRDELWPKHPLTEPPRSLEELYEVEIESFLNGETEESEFILSSLKSTDDVALPESGVYFDTLEARIMGALDAAIGSGEVPDRDQREPAAVQLINPVLMNKNAKRAAARRAAVIRAGQMVLFAFVVCVMAGKWLITPRTSALKVAHAVEPKVPKSRVVADARKAKGHLRDKLASRTSRF